MNDLVSKTEVIKRIKEQYNQHNELIPFWLSIGDIPIVKERPTAEWIPVKDRMPEFNDIVFASVDSDYDELRVIITVYKAEEFWFNGTIKAWMPLPEPYKED